MNRASLVAPRGAVPTLAVAVVRSAHAAALAQARLAGAAAEVRAAGFATDAVGAVRASQAVRAVEESVAVAVRELLTLGRLLGLAQETLDSVEAGVAADCRGWFTLPDPSPADLLHPLVTGGDAILTLGARAFVDALPRDSWLLVDALGHLVPEGPGDATAVPDALPGGDTAPTTLDGWLSRVDAVSNTPGRLAITAVGGGAWVVQLPGIHTLLPSADPQDLPGALAGLGTGHSAYAGAVVVALQRAGVPPGARLLLVGHSQGGIVATGLAADPQVTARWQVTHVVTAGSPISRAPVRAGTALLEIDNRDDLVTALDTSDGTDGGGRTVLSFRREHGDIGRDHGLAETYVPFVAGPAFTGDPRARAFVTGARDYLRGGPARTQVFALRDRPAPAMRAPGPPLPGAAPAIPAPRRDTQALGSPVAG